MRTINRNDSGLNGGNSRSKVVELPLPSLALSGGLDVERINQFAFYAFGQTLKALTIRTGPVTPTWEVLMQLWQGESAINELLKGAPVPIAISRPAAEALRSAIRDVIRAYFYKENEEGNAVFAFPAEDAKSIEEWQWNAIKSAISTFETVFGAEMQATAAYFVPRRGIFWTPALVDSADESFPKHLMGHIPEKTREDWKAAGRCLAFNLLSASGFHVARAVEGTIELYYQLFSEKTGTTLASWHEYAKELGKIAAAAPKPSPAAKTLAEFSQMKDDYRNPIMHPRVSLSESDARMLFDNGESLIIAMAEEIRAIREAGGVQGALAVITRAETGS